MSQLRQPGDYLKYNRTRTLPPRIHTFSVETNQKRKEKYPKNTDRIVQRQNSSDHEREQFETADSPDTGSAQESWTKIMRKNRHRVYSQQK